jgi:hypothetical protein
MRSSSVKTLVSAVSVTLTLVLAAPSIEARPSQRQRPTQSAPSVVDRAQRVVRQMLKHVYRISSNILPTDPVPVMTSGSTDSILPTDPVPVEKP